jgi:hypothetical protein
VGVSAAEQTQGPLFRARTVLVMVLVGVVSFSALLVLSAYAPDLRSGSDGGAHALSKSAVGYAGLVRLLKDLGEPVVVSHGPPPAVRAGSGLLVLTPTPGTEPKALKPLRFGGMTLVVLPKWATGPQPLNPQWVDKIDTLPGPMVVRALEGSTVVERRKGVSNPVLWAVQGAPFFGDGDRFALGPVDSLQTISGPQLQPILTDESGKAVLAQSRSQPILVLSDPDLLNTHGLGDLATARAAVGVLDVLRAGGPVVFDVTLAGFSRGRSLLRLAFEPPLLGATLCLAVAALMMGLHAWVRFGPETRPTRALALGKRALADNSAALVRMAKREPRMAEPYAALTRDAVARMVGAPRDLSPDQLEALLDRLGAARGIKTTFSSLAAEARAARTTADLMQAAHKLFQWRGEMRRDRR